MMKTLPFKMNPQIRTYLNHAYAFGMVEGVLGSGIIPRLSCESYVNCIYSQDDANKFYIYTYNDDGWFEKTGMVSREVHVCDDPNLKCVSEALRIAIDRINNGEYVLCCPNEGRLSAHKMDEPYNFEHECLLWGVDTERRVFQSSGYVRILGKYMQYEIGFDELTDALINVCSGYVELIFYKVDADFVFAPPNIDNVVFLLGEYLASDCSELSKREDIKNYIDDGKLKFGITVWDELADYIGRVDSVDMRYIRGFADHKYLMHQRVKYLSENGYLRNGETYTEKAEDIYKRSVNLFYILMKCLYQPADADMLRGKVIGIVRDINEIERNYLPRVVYELEHGTPPDVK